MKKVLVLGAGLVSRPLVDYLLKQGHELTVADQIVSKAERIVAGHPNGRPLALNIDDVAALRKTIVPVDLVVSLLPAARHIDAARICLELGKHLVTTSYVSPQMAQLDASAKEKGLLFLNEMGADPGTDHMSAMRVIHSEGKKGGTLTSFISWCGGLPAPEANDNPLGYKFSWTPRGVLLAAKNSARYLKAGKIVTIPSAQLFSNLQQVEIPGVGIFEGYPNRDSVSYLATYGLGASVREMFRGTLRNLGHCRLLTQIVRLGLLEDEPKQKLAGQTYRGLLEKLLGSPLEGSILSRLGVKREDSVLPALEQIGVLDNKPIQIEQGSVLDVMVERMSESMQYRPGERDMLLMRHDMTFEYDAGRRKERITAILADFGIPHGDSSMARVVSYTAAIGARLILEDRLELRGVHIPVSAELYSPILHELENLGIAFTETRTTL